jgi:hypothetical protein
MGTMSCRLFLLVFSIDIRIRHLGYVIFQKNVIDVQIYLRVALYFSNDTQVISSCAKTLNILPGGRKLQGSLQT